MKQKLWEKKKRVIHAKKFDTMSNKVIYYKMVFSLHAVEQIDFPVVMRWSHQAI